MTRTFHGPTRMCSCGLPFVDNPDTGTCLCVHCDCEPLPDHRQVRCPECVRLLGTDRNKP